MRHPLYVAFVWHMHQPHYLDEDSGQYILPWVRLHATKDYLHMAEVLEDYPEVHATFNMVPCLVEQLQGYVAGTASDRAWEVSLRDRLSREDKIFVDSLFYSINEGNLIRSYPRYRQLLQVRESADGDLDLLGDTYWRDLVAWFNLAWIDPGWIQRDPVLRALVAKGSHFSLVDVATILDKQREIMAAVVPVYRRLQRRRQVELSVSPYYHPILPLLIDSSCAREPSPWLRLPATRFRWRGDALEQLRSAVAHHEATFGRSPSGLWPSEGSVSQDVIDLLGEVPEIRWLATDEAILAHSLGRAVEHNGWGYVTDPRFLYQPYWLRSGEHRVATVFRDHYLSDRIGFTYQGMTGKQAAEDLMFRFAAIHEMVKDDPNPHIVSIILDGENCWEHFERNGETFLRTLYEMLTGQQRVRAVTVSEFLDEFPPHVEIPRLATGSWINGNLETWIGEDAQNRAWEYLVRAREALATAESGGDVPAARMDRARRCMMAAEGSDWFWWYYSHNVSDQDDLFDRLFRHNLAGVYRAMSVPVPDSVLTPIMAELPKLASRAPTGYIRPLIATGATPRDAWAAGGYIDPTGSTGAMQQGSCLLKRLYYGYDDQSLYVRLESHACLKGYLVDAYVVRLGGPSPRDGVEKTRRAAIVRPSVGRPSREITIRPDHGSIELNRWEEDAGWIRIEADARLVVGDTALEAVVPLESLGVEMRTTVALSVVLFKDNLLVQRLPDEGELLVELAPYDE